MSDILGISSGAISAYQRALTTVSNNIANVNTEGYSRQDVVLKDNTPRKMAGMYLGTGVMLQNIRRQFDQFAEQNLRNSASDLSAQAPMVDYTQRVINVMGDASIGLNTAFDNFFAAADALSADPASTVQRASFLRNADGVASRFGELSTQINQVGTEIEQGMQGVIDEINNYASQLSVINQSLARSPSLEAQPAELLDRRDLALRKLSELARVKIAFATNGQVTVGLGNTLNEGLLVTGVRSRTIGLDTSAGKTEILLDPYGQTENIPGVSGGRLGGYMSFTTQVLQPAKQQLNELAQVFVKETNGIQRNGIDGYGQLGQDLFRIDPTASQPSAGVQVAVTDGLRIATAAQFRVSEGNSNVTTTRATVRYVGTPPTTALSNAQLVNNPTPTAGVSLRVDGARVFAPVTAVSAGVGATFYLDDMGPGQQLQVLTRDGQQLLGKSLTETEKFQLLTQANGFTPGMRYGDTYLNQVDTAAYRHLDYFYGAKAAVLTVPRFDGNGVALAPTTEAASLTTGRLSQPLGSVADAALQLNGVSLSAYTPQTQGRITLSGLAANDHFNGLGLALKLGSESIQLSSTDLDSGAVTSVSGFATAIQNAVAAKGLSQDLKVDLVNNGQDIQIKDMLGREVSLATLTLDPAADPAPSVGQVRIGSGVPDMAQWINGETQAVFDALYFGTTTPGFSAFDMQLDNVDYHLALPAPADGGPTDINALAQYLQTQLRERDRSTQISVTVVNGEITLQDLAGRALQSMALTPIHPDPGGATTGAARIRLSHAAQSGVRAEAFSEIKIPLSQLDLAQPVSINGVMIEGYKIVDNKIKAYESVNEWIDTVNRSAAGVKAEIDTDGQLKISNALGAAITLDSLNSGNALNLRAGVYGAQIRMTQAVRDLTVPLSQVDWKRPLALNQVKVLPGVASYNLPAPTASNAEMALTWPASVRTEGLTLSGLSRGSAPNYGGFDFQIQVGQRTLQIAGNDLSGATDMSQLASQLQALLNDRVGGQSLRVEPTASGDGIHITEADGRDLSAAQFSANALAATDADTGTSQTALTQLVQQLNGDAHFAASFTASQTDAGALQIVAKGAASLDGVLVNGQPYTGPINLAASRPVTVSWPVTTPTATSPQDLVDRLNADTDFVQSFRASVSASGKLIVRSTQDGWTDASLASALTLRVANAADPVTANPAVDSLDGLIERLRDLAPETGVTASLNAYGDLVLTSTDVTGRAAISIGGGVSADGTPIPNALGMLAMDYGVSERLQRDLLVHPDHKDIRLQFGAQGEPVDLATLGLRTAAYIEGGCPEDLLVFVTGKGAAKVAASFSGTPTDLRQSLRQQSLTVSFTGADRYQILDDATGTVLAERSYDPNTPQPVVDFHGLQLQLSRAPQVGDRFRIDGNQDGLGNNVNMLEMAELAKRQVVGGKTLHDAYIDHVNDIGNLGQQAKITQQAMQVVSDQAKAARDKVSGVNLDDEAAALIRYQQAYQAAAKAMQVSRELFDAVAQIR